MPRWPLTLLPLVALFLGCGPSSAPEAPTPAPSPTSASLAEPAATPTPAPELPPNLIRSAASELGASSALHADADTLARLMDGDPSTAFSFGVGDQDPNLTVRLPEGAHVTGLELIVGDVGRDVTGELFLRHARVEQLTVDTEMAELTRASLDATSQAPQQVAFTFDGPGVLAIGLTITEQEYGSPNELHISELRLLGRYDGAPVAPRFTAAEPSDVSPEIRAATTPEQRYSAAFSARRMAEFSVDTVRRGRDADMPGYVETLESNVDIAQLDVLDAWADARCAYCGLADLQRAWDEHYAAYRPIALEAFRLDLEYQRAFGNEPADDAELDRYAEAHPQTSAQSAWRLRLVQERSAIGARRADLRARLQELEGRIGERQCDALPERMRLPAPEDPTNR